MTARAPRGDVGRGPVDASMTLLNEVMRRPLDPGYQQAADRRRVAGNPPVGALQRVWIFGLAIVLGLLTATAAVDLRAPQPAVARARVLLEKQISERTAAASALVAENERRSAQIAELQNAAIGTTDPQLLAQLAADGVSSGTLAVAGPGLRITVQDAPTARDNPDPGNADDRVQDVDLQIAVNGLWAAGAEAIAINGHRLTALTAIRSAGSAILVDLVPLSSPYVVEAIGDQARLATRFARTTAGQHLATLRNTYGIGTEITSEKRLKLPGSTEAHLSSAAATGGPTSGPTGPTGASSPSAVASSAPTGEGGTP